MSALTLFKQAGIDNKLGFDFSQITNGVGQLGQTLAPYAQSGLIGAGLGGAGMGLASLLGGEDNESPDQRRNRILANVLKGVALGGTAGAGYQAVKDKWFSHPSATASSETQKVLNSGATSGRFNNDPLDTKPLGVNHPWLQQGVNIGNGHVPGVSDVLPSVGMGTTGAAVGAGLNWNLNRLAAQGLAKNKDGKLVADSIADVAKNNQFMGPNVKQRMLERMISSKGGNMPVGDIDTFIAESNLHGQHGPRLGRSLHNLQAAAQGKFEPLSHGNQSFISQAKRVLSPYSRQTLENTQLGSKLTNVLGKVTSDPMAFRNVARYGKYGLGGAAAGLGLQGAVGLGTNALMHAKYTPEQMKLWSQGGL